MANRHVSLSVFFGLFFKRLPFAALGLKLIITAVFTLIIISVLQFSFRAIGPDTGPDTNYDIVRQFGTETKAEIIDISTEREITVNDRNPYTITYTYNDGGAIVTNQFRTLDDSAYNLNRGDTITVKTFEHKSYIKNMKPFDFTVPFALFFILPGIFFAGGLVLLILAYIPARKTYRLYKYGNIAEAHILSMIPYSASFLSYPRSGMLTEYYILNPDGTQKKGTIILADIATLATAKPGSTFKMLVSEDGTQACEVPKNFAVDGQ